MTGDDSTLEDFGLVDSPDPPNCHRKAIVESPTKDKIAGFIVHDRERDCRGYTTLRSYGTYYRNGDGFAISETILNLCANRGVARVYVHDARDGIEEGDVHEFTLREYRAGAQVPERDREVEWDRQRVVPLEDARHHWPDRGNDLYVSSFSHACDRIHDGRRYDPTPLEGR